MKYLVGITVYNCFEIEADNEDEAEVIASAMTNVEILNGSDFNITYVDEALP